ncbi:uncharacterized protein [Rutidosis leptorrhynchoides]|uniref:uncharacterized protein n=1 Tax=Rutidosis leptorrhynchoides TaxID=125765 RepID=UPI003A99FE79
MKPHVVRDDSGGYWWKTNASKLKPYCTSTVWKDMRPNVPKINWHHMVWFPQVTLKHAFIIWLALKGRLSTQDRLMLWYPQETFKCSLCGQCEDSHSHLFFKCDFSSQLWEKTKQMLVYKGRSNDLQSIISDLIQYTSIKDIRNVLNKIAIAAAVYYVWMERNNRLFKNVRKSVDAVYAELRSFIRMKLSSLKVKNNPNVQMVARLSGMQIVGNHLQM